MVMHVRPFLSVASAAATAASLLLSSAAVASSRMSTCSVQSRGEGARPASKAPIVRAPLHD